MRHARLGQVDLLQALAEIEMVALRGQAAGDGARPYRHEHFAVRTKLAQHVHILCIAQPTFDEPYVARAAMLDVRQRRRSNSTGSSSAKGVRRHRARTCGSRRAGHDVVTTQFCSGRAWRCNGHVFPSSRASSSACALIGAPCQRCLIGTAKDSLANDGANWTHPERLVAGCKVGIRQPSRFRVYDQVLVHASPAQCEYLLVVDVTRGAHAQFAQHAAIEVEQHLAMRGVHRPVREEMAEASREHAEIVAQRLQHTLPLCSHDGQKWLPSAKSDLHEGATQVVQLFRVALDFDALPRRRTGCDGPAIDARGAELAAAVPVNSGCSRVWNVAAGRERRMQHGLTRIEWNLDAVEQE
jgi:hypothetical protein